MISILTFIHGDDLVASRRKLAEEKNRIGVKEIISLDGTKITFSDLILACETRSLLSEKKIILIENLLLGGVTKGKLKLLSYLGKANVFYPVVVWEDREIEKQIVKKYFSQAKEILCQPPQLFFRFLDSIGLQPPNQLLSLFHAVLAQREAELIYALLLRKFRQLIIACDLGGKGLTELRSWQIDKLMRQSRESTVEKLISSYRQLLSFDYKIKSGQTPYSLSQLLDIFLTTL